MAILGDECVNDTPPFSPSEPGSKGVGAQVAAGQVGTLPASPQCPLSGCTITCVRDILGLLRKLLQLLGFRDRLQSQKSRENLQRALFMWGI